MEICKETSLPRRTMCITTVCHHPNIHHIITFPYFTCAIQCLTESGLRPAGPYKPLSCTGHVQMTPFPSLMLRRPPAMTTMMTRRYTVWSMLDVTSIGQAKTLLRLLNQCCQRCCCCCGCVCCCCSCCCCC